MRGASARKTSIPTTVASRPPVSQGICQDLSSIMHHPAFPLAASVDQWAGPPATPANRHATLMTRPASGDKEKAGLCSDISDIADINLLHDPFAYLQVQMPFEHDPHECATLLQALLRDRGRGRTRRARRRAATAGASRGPYASNLQIEGSVRAAFGGRREPRGLRSVRHEIGHQASSNRKRSQGVICTRR